MWHCFLPVNEQSVLFVWDVFLDGHALFFLFEMSFSMVMRWSCRFLSVSSASASFFIKASTDCCSSWTSSTSLQYTATLTHYNLATLTINTFWWSSFSTASFLACEGKKESFIIHVFVTISILFNYTYSSHSTLTQNSRTIVHVMND